MAHHEETWGWMLATDFFLAGMGAAMLVVAGFVDLYLGPGQISFIARLIAPVCVAAGAGLLVFELGKPFEGWRVFVNPKSILTFGAWNMTFAILSGFALATFYVPACITNLLPASLNPLPWASITALRVFFEVLTILFGLVVASYPGVLLATHVSRPFWTGPGIAVLFILSSFTTGLAFHQVSNFVLAPDASDAISYLRMLSAILLLLQTALLPIYVAVKRKSGTAFDQESAGWWSSGKMAKGFWFVTLVGSAVPLIIEAAVPAAIVGAAVLTMLGGLVFRNIVTYTGQDRTWLPGEKEYYAHLPEGSERFMKVLKTSIRTR